ncbi:MAG TPA: beta-ketoacyl synthase N-terminal-like domain-containing protein [Burkholderiales bacterium]|nr:beta-ketoacyl synthase N-terminal-like domain-containing protein [Burkholderiales bacterium]
MSVRRVLVTGMGIVSCIGNDLDTVARALREGRSGIAAAPEFVEAGLGSQIAGIPSLDSLPPVKRPLRRFMSDPSLYAYHAAGAALADAGLSEAEITSERTALVVGSGVSSTLETGEAIALAKAQGARKVPPYVVPRVMGSTTSANLATAFRIQGASYSIVSACATSAHCIGHGAELIQMGKADRVIVGGAEEVRWTSAVLFDAMGALSTGFNDRPTKAARPYDKRRDGFVLAGGAGILVLEAAETAQARGARVRAELAGYGASSDGSDMVTPKAEGIARAMRAALREARVSETARIDYINTHGTSTVAGDLMELDAIREVFGDTLPSISSTKGLTGHAIGASGAHEAIYCLLMMEHGFIAACANLDEPDPAIRGLPIIDKTRAASLDAVMSNSLGFGGTNASLIFRRWPGTPG